jgi:hypothetical protein
MQPNNNQEFKTNGEKNVRAYRLLYIVAVKMNAK